MNRKALQLRTSSTQTLGEVLTNTPLRRLQGISYWVIEDPTGIQDFINTEVRKEWELDVRSLPGDPAGGNWLPTLSQRRWRLEIVQTDQIKLDDRIMNYVDKKTGYNFSEHIAKRRQQLRHAIEAYGTAIWPIIIRKEDMQVLDGYCRYTTLREMGVSRIYSYIGII
jgi:hypothetical protein